MSDRDEFAKIALAGLLREAPGFGTLAKPCNPWPWFAEQAYKCADAMLAARGKPQGVTLAGLADIAEELQDYIAHPEILALLEQAVLLLRRAADMEQAHE